MVVPMALPVLVTFYNRPETLRVLLSIISEVEGLDLYFAADGPKSEQDSLEVERCWEVVSQFFPLNPDSNSLRRVANRGCKLAMKENLDWFFSINSFGVVLEDDCYPHPEFFVQMARILQEPKLKRFMTISGGNYLGEKFTSPRSSMFPMIWGWGTWAENWKLYELQITDSKKLMGFPLREMWSNRRNANVLYFKNTFEKRFSEVSQGHLDTWDYSLTASSWRHERLNLHLGGNLVVNGGFNSLATHTFQDAPAWVPTQYAVEPLCLDSIDSYIPSLDRLLARKVFGCTGISLIKNLIKRVLLG